tara:strand:- start:577 stop:708 length:132 start_codon:yes stop_codon:yes gene_type:complete
LESYVVKIRYSVGGIVFKSQGHSNIDSVEPIERPGTGFILDLI